MPIASGKKILCLKLNRLLILYFFTFPHQREFIRDNNTLHLYSIFHFSKCFPMNYLILWRSVDIPSTLNCVIRMCLAFASAIPNVWNVFCFFIPFCAWLLLFFSVPNLETVSSGKFFLPWPLVKSFSHLFIQNGEFHCLEIHFHTTLWFSSFWCVFSHGI